MGRRSRGRCQRASLILFCAPLALAIVDEACTSRLQSIVLSRHAARFTYDIGSGPSLRIVFPSSGPHDQQPGYSRVPEFTNRLVSRRYRIAEQAQMSKAAAQLVGLGIAPPYREKASGGLVVRGASGAVMFDARPPKTALRALRGRAAAPGRELAVHRGPRTAWVDGVKSNGSGRRPEPNSSWKDSNLALSLPGCS